MSEPALLIPTASPVPIPRTTSATDPAFHADVVEMTHLAQQLLDRLELLEDTAPHDLPAETRPALQRAATLAARCFDTLNWLTDPTKPRPEHLDDEEDDDMRIDRVRTFLWRPTVLTLEPAPEGADQPDGQSWVSATWMRDRTAPELPLLEISQLAPLVEGSVTMVTTTLHVAWEVGALRRASQRGALPPALHLLLRQLLIAGLEQDPEVPPIAIHQPTRRPLAEVARA